MDKSLKIAIGSDHAGFLLKEKIKKHFAGKLEIKDHGCYSEERADYPDFAHPVALDVEAGKADYGILICGSGNGINIAANKHQGIRSALCWKKGLAELARQHNDANVIALPARFVSEQEAIDMVEVFLNTAFEGGRHTERVKKISC